MKDLKLAILLLLVPIIYSLDDGCWTKCIEKYNSSQEAITQCKDGCRLSVVFGFVSGDPSESSIKCRNGCMKSYTPVSAKDACSFGCDSQPLINRGQVDFSISNDEPTFGVVRDAMSGVFPKISNIFPSFDGIYSSEDEFSWRDPFTEMRRQMQREMARMEAITQHLLNPKQGDVGHIETHHPNGHIMNALYGDEVGNSDERGSPIVEVSPVHPVHLLGHEGENPTVQQSQSWFSRLVDRAHRLSALSQWLVFAALLLCLISMLSISLAILRQIKNQRYRGLNRMNVIIPSTFGGPLPSKKIPLETECAPTTDYPLIHDAPPPAYDQLSVHKTEEPKS